MNYAGIKVLWWVRDEVTILFLSVRNSGRRRTAGSRRRLQFPQLGRTVLLRRTALVSATPLAAAARPRPRPAAPRHRLGRSESSPLVAVKRRHDRLRFRCSHEIRHQEIAPIVDRWSDGPFPSIAPIAQSIVQQSAKHPQIKFVYVCD